MRLKITPEEKALISEYLDLFWFLTDEQFSAICHEIPMTRDIYDSCITLCCQLGNDRAMCNLMEEYPCFMEASLKEHEAALSQIDLPEESPEQVQLFIKNFKKRLEENTPSPPHSK